MQYSARLRLTMLDLNSAVWAQYIGRHSHEIARQVSVVEGRCCASPPEQARVNPTPKTFFFFFFNLFIDLR